VSETLSTCRFAQRMMQASNPPPPPAIHATVSELFRDILGMLQLQLTFAMHPSLHGAYLFALNLYLASDTGESSLTGCQSDSLNFSSHLQSLGTGVSECAPEQDRAGHGARQPVQNGPPHAAVPGGAPPFATNFPTTHTVQPTRRTNHSVKRSSQFSNHRPWGLQETAVPATRITISGLNGCLEAERCPAAYAIYAW